jgi:hypothetical protein
MPKLIQDSPHLAPARNVLEYQVKPIRAVPSDPTPYMGSTDLVDQAWRDLMRRECTFVTPKKSFAEKDSKTSARFQYST